VTFLLALLAAAGAASAGSTQPVTAERNTSCQGALCRAGTLRPYFNKLARANAREPGSRPVHILQIGDSHTAGDAITGGWRELLQAQYGSGGRGVLPPGRPYQGYLTHGITASMTGAWTTASTFGSASQEPRPALGLSGFSLTSASEGASMGLVADPGQEFDRFVICAQARPGAGTLNIQMGLSVEQLRLSSHVSHPECRTVRTDRPQSVVRVTATGGPVTITSWATFRDSGGVVLSNLGVVGSQLMHFGRTSDAVIAEELKAYRPDLVVIAFGTNEGFAPRVSPGEYEIVLRSEIGRIRRLIGNTPLLILGAPDANSRNLAHQANAPGVAIDCNVRRQSLNDIVAGLRESEAAGAGAQTPVTGSDPANRPLFVPPGLGAVQDVQRRVAADLNIAYWDWEARMGGPCSAAKKVFAPVPGMRGDFVHFTRSGGWEIGRALQSDLAAAARALSAQEAGSSAASVGNH